MTDAQSMRGPAAGDGYRWLTAAISLTVGAAFFGLWFWLLPSWLGFSVEMAGAARWRWLAAVPSVLGFAVALRCVWDFGWTGRGTPVPVAPPQRLVVVGLYLHVRNPMYLGFAAGWIGLWVIFGHANPVRSLPSQRLRSACTCLLSFTKNPHCVGSSARSTKSIAETCVAGGRVCGDGISRDPRIWRMRRRSGRLVQTPGVLFAARVQV